jgi:acid phosphatase (class A)
LNNHITRAIALAGVALIFSVRSYSEASQGAAQSVQPDAANPTAIDKMKLPSGYMPRAQLPDSLLLLPPPPRPGSAAMKADEQARAAAMKLRGSARYRLASEDAVIGFPEIPNDFACSVGFAISKETTPRLYGLMAKMLIDVGLSTYKAKDYYKRSRPFVVHHTSTCYPKDDALLRHDGSYPSGHSALGWGYALVLAELDPSHADAILTRGRDFGQSRLVCGAHWQSDIDEGRVIAAATVARLHADSGFREDLEAARAEVIGALQQGKTPVRDCATEASALTAR